MSCEDMLMKTDESGNNVVVTSIHGKLVVGNLPVILNKLPTVPSSTRKRVKKVKGEKTGGWCYNK